MVELLFDLGVRTHTLLLFSLPGCVELIDFSNRWQYVARTEAAEARTAELTVTVRALTASLDASNREREARLGLICRCRCPNT